MQFTQIVGDRNDCNFAAGLCLGLVASFNGFNVLFTPKRPRVRRALTLGYDRIARRAGLRRNFMVWDA
jgi:hypothetical protein